MSSSSITGCWVGHYEWHGRSHPITANFLESGQHITGTMRDDAPECEYTLFEIAADLSSEVKEQIEQCFRDLVPHATAGSIHYLTRLPSDSSIQGRRDGQVVSFAKKYAGEFFGGYKAGGEIIGTQINNHTVYYEGSLTYDDLELKGRWFIEARSEYGAQATEGSFLLRRVDQESVSAPSSKFARQNRPWWKFW